MTRPRPVDPLDLFAWSPPAVDTDAVLTLLDRRGAATAYVLLDAEDLPLALEHKWHLSNHGYVRANLRGPRRGALLLHRVLLGLGYGDRRQGDHINRNPLDNRRANLRIVTNAQNAQNMSPHGATSKYRGVAWDSSRGKWRAQSRRNGFVIALGRYHDELEAARAAYDFRALHMPHAYEERP